MRGAKVTRGKEERKKYRGRSARTPAKKEGGEGVKKRSKSKKNSGTATQQKRRRKPKKRGAGDRRGKWEGTRGTTRTQNRKRTFWPEVPRPQARVSGVVVPRGQ